LPARARGHPQRIRDSREPVHEHDVRLLHRFTIMELAEKIQDHDESQN